MKFRKRPVVIEAYQTLTKVAINTREGEMIGNPGDWIITGVKGEKYPCKPDIFELTYEKVDAPLPEAAPKIPTLKIDADNGGITFECDQCINVKVGMAPEFVAEAGKLISAKVWMSDITGGVVDKAAPVSEPTDVGKAVELLVGIGYHVTMTGNPYPAPVATHFCTYCGGPIVLDEDREPHTAAPVPSVTMEEIRAFLGPDVGGVVWQPSPEYLADWLRDKGIVVKEPPDA